MLASGLRVIEYDSKFTEKDMPSDYFYKIRNTDRILETNELLHEVAKELRADDKAMESLIERKLQGLGTQLTTALGDMTRRIDASLSRNAK
jgi:hypothetical protein